MVQGLKFLSKKSFHPQNRNNQKRVWEREQEKDHEQTRIREREAQLRRERQDEELAQSRGDNKLQFLYKPPPGLIETSETKEKLPVKQQQQQQQDDNLFERQPGDDDAAAAFRRLLAGQSTEQPIETITDATTTTFGTVLQGSNADRSDAPKPLLTALEKSVGRKKHQNLTFDEQIQRFPALANAPRAKGVSATDVGVTFHPLGTQIRNVRCLACGTWGHSRGDRECSKTGWNPFAATTSPLESSVSISANGMQQHPSTEQTTKRERRKDDSSSSSSNYSDLEDRRRRHKRHRKSRDRSPSRSKRNKEKKKSKKSKKS